MKQLRLVAFATALTAMTALTELPASAAESNCGELPASQQAMCWMVMSCSAIDEADRRQDCFRTAMEREVTPAERARRDKDVEQQAVATRSRRESEARTRAAAEVAPEVAEEQEVVVTADGRGAGEEEEPGFLKRLLTREDKDADKSAKDDDDDKPGMISRILGRQSGTRADAKSPPVKVATINTSAEVNYDLPVRFSGSVTASRMLMLGGQLIVIDGVYLYELDRATHAGISEGDEVEVAEKRSFFGKQVRVKGPVNRPVDGRRIACEKDVVGAKSRRKCKVLNSS